MNKTKADVLIFGGQSNMVGETEGLPEVNEPVSGAFEYRYMSNELTELKHPVGEDLFNGNLQMSVNGGGSLVPSFCQKYCDITGKSVIVIQAACGFIGRIRRFARELQRQKKDLTSDTYITFGCKANLMR